MKHLDYDTVLCETLEQPVLGISRLSPCDSWERPQPLVTLNWLSRRGWMNGWMCEIDEPMLCILNCVFGYFVTSTLLQEHNLFPIFLQKITQFDRINECFSTNKVI